MTDHDVNDDQGLDRGLTAELGALRDALREVRVSDADERRLLAALATRRAATRPRSVEVEPAPLPIPTRRGVHAWRLRFAVAAAAALAVVTAMITLRVERPGDIAPASSGAPAAARQPAELQESVGAFQPLAFSPGLSPSQSYSVVRVRIPLTALAPGHSAPPDATIEADLLVGEDGLASGIRFDRADTLFVSTVSTETGERR